MILMPRFDGHGGWLSAPSARGDVEEVFAGGWAGEAQPLPVLEEVHGGPRLARAIVLAVLTVYAANQIIDLSVSPLPSHGSELSLDLPAIVVLYALTVWLTSAAAERWSPRRRLAMLLTEGILTYLPIAVFGKLWGDMAGFFTGSALLLLSGWAAWAVFAAAISSVLVLSALSGVDAYGVAYLTLSTLVLGLVVFGLARLSLLISYVHTRRGELAQLAVVSERMRFARDLHDLLGYSLSAITLKAELTKRLVDSNPARARDELAEVLDIARQALADVRIVATGYRRISLAKEASSVTSLLSEAGIETQVAIDCTGLAEKTDTVLATVLREAVTNMLRHSTARHCDIEAGIVEDTIRLLVSNDGVPGPAATGRVGGGIENLSTRLASIGGNLTARIRDDGRFEVLAQAPLVQAFASQRGPEARLGRRRRLWQLPGTPPV
jgi:two-component system, NarL family, sensor histidine kinase DesK